MKLLQRQKGPIVKTITKQIAKQTADWTRNIAVLEIDFMAKMI